MCVVEFDCEPELCHSFKSIDESEFEGEFAALKPCNRLTTSIHDEVTPSTIIPMK